MVEDEENCSYGCASGFGFSLRVWQLFKPCHVRKLAFCADSDRILLSHPSIHLEPNPDRHSVHRASYLDGKFRRLRHGGVHYWDGHGQQLEFHAEPNQQFDQLHGDNEPGVHFRIGNLYGSVQFVPCQ